MKEKRLLNALGQVDTKYIEEASHVQHTKKPGWLKWGTVAACLCLIVAAVFAISHTPTSTPGDSQHMDAGDPSLDGDPSGYGQSSDLVGQEVETPDLSPVHYSSLSLQKGIQCEEALTLSSSAMMDIKAFDESALSQDGCRLIVEGVVTNLYVKHYTYDFYSDKFEENGILHGKTATVVYEVTVERTWYGDATAGETILVEDTTYFIEPILALQEGKRYVLPLYEYGDTIWTGVHEYANGDITRETSYSTVYPFHPQIEVTDDGTYLLSQDWTTLVAKNAREVIMDTMEDNSYYWDKMCLVDGNTFAEQMDILITSLP